MPAPLLLLLALQTAPSAPPAGVTPAPAPAATPVAPAPTPVAPAPTPAPTSVAPTPAPAPAPVLSSGVSDTAAPMAPAAPMAAPPPQEAKKPPREVGPFFVEEPPEETRFPGGPRRADPPRFSIGRGKFCFVDDAACRASLIATADVGVGVNVTRGADYSFAQFNFRGGLVLKPLTLTKDGGWHPWGLGLGAGWSRGTGNPGSMEGGTETTHTPAFRVFLVNQLWLSQKRNAFHLDVDFGIIRSPVPASMSRYLPAYGTHAGVSVNWGGWGGIFLAGDFLYQDTRVVFGFRGHGVAAGPAIGLILLGLLAGGAFQ